MRSVSAPSSSAIEDVKHLLELISDIKKAKEVVDDMQEAAQEITKEKQSLDERISANEKQLSKIQVEMEKLASEKEAAEVLQKSNNALFSQLTAKESALDGKLLAFEKEKASFDEYALEAKAKIEADLASVGLLKSEANEDRKKLSEMKATEEDRQRKIQAIYGGSGV